MSWTHDPLNHLMYCSDRQDPNKPIKLPGSGGVGNTVYCTDCWRNCLFFMYSKEELDRIAEEAGMKGEEILPRVMHLFNPRKYAEIH